LRELEMERQTGDRKQTASIPIDTPVWDRFVTVAPLVIVGTREGGGGYDLAPKHMAMPLGWQNYYCFVCSPRHATQHNVEATGEFTVSFPRPDQVVQASMAAPRIEDGSKPALAALETLPASTVDGVLVRGAYLWLECALERMLEGFGDNTLIIGRVLAASADERILRGQEADNRDPIRDAPLLVYVSPGRFASVEQSSSFPFHADFRL
jgi:flavin reductase (DIM6/NTAB) family NADH-FMN oxidoreductase RutF